MSKYIVRYGAMRNLGVMSSRNDHEYKRGMEVVVRSNRGLEVGQVLSQASDDALSHLDNPPSGQILRLVSDDDASEVSHLDGKRKERFAACQRHIDNLKLDMKLVEIEQLFGGERMVIYYLADDRVDFRQLVKDLASEFQTRIEMKQIGVRDEAKLLADYGDCGKPVCCATHLVSMPPVSMKMAKLQKATLDPTKISGRCGRLKCCLRYEFDNYETIQKQLPRVGSHVLTRNGRMRVLSQEILAEQLLVETEDHRRMLIDASEVLSVIKKDSNPRSKPAHGSHQKTDSPTQDQQTSEDARGSARHETDSTTKRSGAGNQKVDDDRRPAGEGRRRRNRKPKRNSDHSKSPDEPHSSSDQSASANQAPPAETDAQPNNPKASDQSQGKPKSEGPAKPRRNRRGRRKGKPGGNGPNGGQDKPQS